MIFFLQFLFHVFIFIFVFVFVFVFFSQRTFFSFLSGIITFIVAWLIFGQDSNDHLSAESSMDFTVIKKEYKDLTLPLQVRPK